MKVPTTSTNFISSRARKAEKRKAKTETAQSEKCKRRLFQEDTVINYVTNCHNVRDM